MDIYASSSSGDVVPYGRLFTLKQYPAPLPRERQINSYFPACDALGNGE